MYVHTLHVHVRAHTARACTCTHCSLGSRPPPFCVRFNYTHAYAANIRRTGIYMHVHTLHIYTCMCTHTLCTHHLKQRSVCCEHIRVLIIQFTLMDSYCMCMSWHVLHVYMYISPEERFCCMEVEHIMVLIMGPVLSSISAQYSYSW